MDGIMTRMEKFEQRIRDLGELNAGTVAVEKISFQPELRKACEANHCGNFGRSWVCPPHAGEINDLIAHAKEYSHAIIFQTISPLEDSFDFEGMEAAGKNTRKLLTKIGELAKEEFGSDVLILGAGGCNNCARCAILDKEPCRFPDTAYASLETYGVQVSLLAGQCGMKYINGANTVTYFGGVFVKE